MADPPSTPTAPTGTDAATLQQLLAGGNAHQQAGDLVNLVQLLQQGRQAGNVGADLAKYIVPSGQQYHPGFEPGGLIDQLAAELGIHASVFDGMRSTHPVPLSMFLKPQPSLTEDFTSAKSLLDTLYNPNGTGAAGAPKPGTPGSNAPAPTAVAAGVGPTTLRPDNKGTGVAPLAGFGAPKIPPPELPKLPGKGVGGVATGGASALIDLLLKGMQSFGGGGSRDFGNGVNGGSEQFGR